jgi:nitrite reductase (NO-forming)
LSVQTDQPGFFLYYSAGDGLNGVWEHIANGMYGGIIVRSEDEKPAKEFSVIFSELYNVADQGPFKGTGGTTGSFDLVKFITESPDLVLTNGMAYRHVHSIGTLANLVLNPIAQVFQVKPGELARWYLLNAGPNRHLSFHFSGLKLDMKYSSGVFQVPTSRILPLAPGMGSVIETVFPEEGVYVGMDHNMGNFLRGAVFAVNATNS